MYYILVLLCPWCKVLVPLFIERDAYQLRIGHHRCSLGDIKAQTQCLLTGQLESLQWLTAGTGSMLPTLYASLTVCI